MKNIVEIGTPSRIGKDAHSTIAQFKNLNFPIEIEVENCCPFALALMELPGCFLGSVFSEKNRSGFSVPDYLTLQSFASSAQQIAVLNDVAVAIRVTLVSPEKEEEKSEEAPAAEVPAELPAEAVAETVQAVIEAVTKKPAAPRRTTTRGRANPRTAK